ncbi:MAG: DUF4339 domain-containing protein, partial [Planctomycetaceae bacterium]|nr:DUF4339 domain-containing protein [Planctomycetaceae bacterium]
MADSWHYKLFGIEFGPVPFDALIQLAQSSSIGPNDEVREGEAGEWVPASSIAGLFSAPQSNPQKSSPAVTASSSEGSSARPLLPVSTPSADGSVLFFWQSFGQEFGPVPLDEFREMIQREQLSAGDQMRVETADGWLPLGLLNDLSAAFPSPDAVASTPSADDGVLFYWQSFGQEFGPVPLDDFREMLQREQLSADDLVRIEAADGWLPVAILNDLSAAISPAADVTAAADSVALLPDFDQLESVDAFADMADQAGLEAVELQQESEPQPVSDDFDDVFDEVMSSPAPEKPEPVAVNSDKPAIAAASVQPAIPPPTPAITQPPPVSPPPRPSKQPKPSKAKRTGPLINWGSLFSNSNLNPKLLIPLGIGLAVLLFLNIPWSSGADQEHYETLIGFRDEFRKLRDGKASAAEWKSLEERVQAVTEPMIVDLDKRGGAKNRVPQLMLFAARDFLPKMFQTAKQKP